MYFPDFSIGNTLRCLMLLLDTEWLSSEQMLALTLARTWVSILAIGFLLFKASLVYLWWGTGLLPCFTKCLLLPTFHSESRPIIINYEKLSFEKYSNKMWYEGCLMELSLLGKNAIPRMTSEYWSGIAWNWLPLSSTYKYICVYSLCYLAWLCL